MTPEPHPKADEAARYVLGQLSPGARHEFEVQLTQSAELRALVQELEEGLEAMAQSVPQRRPPPQTWAPIEQAIAREIQQKVVTPPFWSNAWRSGWAAAAACLLTFVGYAWWSQINNNPPAAPALTPVEVAAQNTPPVLTAPRPAPIRPEVTRTTNALTGIVTETVPAETSPELASLRWQVTALRTQLEELSETVLQQKAIMAEPGRFKFFPLTGPITDPENSPTVPLSPGLQRAIFYAMARDLGWVPGPARNAVADQNPASTRTTAWGIDFVDLTRGRSATLASATETTGQIETAAEQSAAAPTSVTVQSSGNVPGYLKKDSGKELVLAFDPTIVSGGSTVQFWSASPTHGQQLIGSALTGENPMVVTVPIENVGSDLTITANSAAGPSNVVGHFYILRYFQPGAAPTQSP